MPKQYTPHSGDRRYAVERYSLDIDYTPRTNRLDGRASLEVRILEAADQLDVDLVGLKAGRVSVDGKALRKVTHGAHGLTVRLPEKREPGARVVIDIEYAGRPKPRRSRWGTLGWEELEDGAMVASQPTGAPTWFPCNDRVDDRARYDIRFTTDREFFVAITGTQGGVTQKGGRRTWTFSSGVPTASYLVALHVGPYEEYPFVSKIASGDLHWRIVTTPGQRATTLRAFADVPRMIEALEDWFGPYPQEDLTVVVTAEELEIPLEAQGMTSFGINHEHPDEERLIAHELAHQWFGNSVDIGRWRDIWLNEGFACFSEWVWSEASGGPSIADKADEHYEILAGLPQDLTLSDPGPDDMFDDRVYKRGALALEALRRTIGHRRFRAVMREWATSMSHRLVTPDELFTVADEHSDAPLAEFWSAWLDEDELPPLPPR